MSTSHTAEVEEIPAAQPVWKQELTERLSAHRTRRGASPDRQPALPGMEPPAPPARGKVAARVAERYAKVPTYREMLAAEAAKAARAAETAAMAAREAQEAAEAVNNVLRAGADVEAEISPVHDAKPSPAPQPAQYRVDPATLPSVRRNQVPQPSPKNIHPSPVEPHPRIVDPLEEALVAPAQPLPARVLEFPRELFATRKARPRIAEGPLREPGSAGADPEKSQLRIFEVEPEAISHQPLPLDAALPEWSSIRLDAIPRNLEAEMSASPTTSGRSARPTRSGAASRSAPLSSRASRQTSSKTSSKGRGTLADLIPLHVAPLGDRTLAALVDGALVLSAFLSFVAVFVACTAHPPSGEPALVVAAAALVGFIALYQWLFFTYAESTPGMRFAKIALCTFDDENPGRKTLQHRVGALFLAALPLGLGFLWALLDDDRLGWHDRMTRTYQRSYK